MNETTAPPESVPSLSERRLAAFAHASILLGPFSNFVGGTLIALVIWITQRQKSTFVRRQALQSLVVQLIFLVVTILMWVLWTIFYLFSLIPLFTQPDLYNDAPPPLFWIGLGSMIIPCGLTVLLPLIGLWPALRTYQGHDFRYPWLGDWLEKYD